VLISSALNSAAPTVPPTNGCSRWQLRRYRQELRLRQGLFLLEESGGEIGDIAVQVGFASHSHFTSAFHRRFGVKPSDFLRWRSRKLIRKMASYSA
jgi:AraC-like DNA-binding protein